MRMMARRDSFEYNSTRVSLSGTWTLSPATSTMTGRFRNGRGVEWTKLTVCRNATNHRGEYLVRRWVIVVGDGRAGELLETLGLKGQR